MLGKKSVSLQSILIKEIIKIIGIGLIALVIVVILKQYRPEFAILVSLVASIFVILFAFEMG